MTAARLVIVRHGVTAWNREGRFQGHLDPPLSTAGRREAQLVARRIAEDDDLRPTRIVSSSLARAAETAESIASVCAVSVERDDRLMEIGQGRWEGRTHDEIAAEDPARYQRWRTATGLKRPPGGETAASATGRLASFVANLAEGGPGDETVCVVSHGGSIRILAALLFDIGLERAWALDVDNASLSVASRGTRGWRVERWNDTHHLLGLEATHVDEADGRPLAL
ncbi:MAG TPA: histidine phosphatase family protein [Candidatus Limnocylindria bacterium]|nr:histidine phosphatase family protein [Candidatus Limnocylindria bacterium]